jgi:hypothetical protein
MQHTRQWLITRLLSAAPIRAGQPLAAVARHCAAPSVDDRAPAGSTKVAADIVNHGLALTVGGHGVLTVACRTPCSLQVLAGEAWVTAEGNFRDIVVEPRSSYPLARNARFSVSPLRETVTFVVAGAAGDAVQFSLVDTGDARTLVVAPLVSTWRRVRDAMREHAAAIESAFSFPRKLRSQS